MPVEKPINKATVSSTGSWPSKAILATKQIVQTNLVRFREHNAAFMFTGSSALVSLCSMLAGVVMIKWISPEDLGLWQSVRLAITYSMFALAGINNGLSRDLPYHLGKSDEKTAHRLAATTLFYISGACFLVLLCGAASMFLYRDHGPKLLAAIATVTMLIVFTFFTHYLIITYRSSKSFIDFSKIKLAEALCILGTIPLLFYLGYNGMLIRLVLLSGLVLGLMFIFRPIRVTPSWDKSSFILLLKTGMPIFILDYLSTTAGTCDRLILLKLGGVKIVGFYALAVTARDAISIIPGALSEYIYPRMSYAYGQNHDPIRLWRMALKSSLMVVAFMIPAVIAGWFLMPPVVTRHFPKYADAVTAAQWLLVASIFSGATLGRVAIWTMKDWRLATWYQVLGTIFGVAGIILGGLCSENHLVGVSLGVLVSQIAWLPVAAFLVYLATHKPRPAASSPTP